MKRLIAVAVFLAATTASASVVQPLGAAPSVLIPAAGSAAGANGTFFRTDVTIINFQSHDQGVQLQWLPSSGTGSMITTTFTLHALTGVRSADFVHDYLNTSGIGSIIITGVAGSAVDPTAVLFVSARIWSPEPGTTGTTSQSFPAIPMSTLNTPGAAALFSLGGPPDLNNFRVNVGIVNADPNNAQTFVVQVSSPTGGTPSTSTWTLAPMSMQQFSIGSNLSTLGQVSIQNITATAMKSNLWTAYGSTIDNVTGDAWSELGVPGFVTPAP